MNRFLPLTVIIFFAFCFCKAGAQSNQTVTNGSPTTAVNFPSNSCAYQWTNNTPGIGLAASGTGNIPVFTAVNNTNSPITATISVTPSNAAFAYICNYGSNSVTVINTSTLATVATIPVGSGPDGIAISPDGNTVYVSNSSSNNVSVIDAVNYTVTATIPAGSGPSGLVLSPDGGTLYVANYGSGTVNVINTATNTIV
ncbi:MAG: beta-propeller fold lactonase family protein, partial [Bacteroidetes bacterium]|nr:beta-propeller fold lactonase family protein [Bacteroidota bacterium]